MRVLGWISAVLGAAALAVAALYALDMRRAYERIDGRSTVVDSPFGALEFVQGGSGPAVLVIHGSGGGYDQGELIARTILGDGFRWIAPSRFGYLRSGLPGGATFDDQAHAYAHLLDHLGIAKVAVVALSHGGPSALLFAVLHPERVSSLTLISCGVASSSEPDQAEANAKGGALTTIFSYDPLYWGASKVLRGKLTRLMGVDDAVMAGLTVEQRMLVDQIIDFMNPVAPRSAGVVFDNQAALPNERIAAIRAPTLIFHAADDGLQLFHNAGYAAATIPGARLEKYDRGGHLLIAVEQPRLRAATQQFVATHAAR